MGLQVLSNASAFWGVGHIRCPTPLHEPHTRYSSILQCLVAHTTTSRSTWASFNIPMSGFSAPSQLWVLASTVMMV
jgi:hypothetical protein